MYVYNGVLIVEMLLLCVLMNQCLDDIYHLVRHVAIHRKHVKNVYY